MSSTCATHHAKQWKLAAIVAAGILYAALAFYVGTHPEARRWAVFITIAPVLLIGWLFARRRVPPIYRWLVLMGLLGLLFWQWTNLQTHIMWVYFAEHAGFNLLLGITFARSLVRGEPLCTVLASRVHPVMTPALLRYSRHLTQAWAAFFFIIFAMSTMLFLGASVLTWSIFAEGLTFPLVGLMFIVESCVRKALLPPADYVGIVGSIRAYRKAMAEKNATEKNTPCQNAPIDVQPDNTNR